MAKQRLLFASPFPPMQTGVADLSAILVQALKEYFDITLLVEDPARHEPNGFPAIGFRDRGLRWNQYPLRFYHIGNNPWYHSYIYECCLNYPGVVLLHDVVLYFLYVGFYRNSPDFYRRVYAEEGSAGVSIVRRLARGGVDLLQFAKPERLAFNRELIHSGNRFISHSEYARKKVVERAASPVDIETIKQAVGLGALPKATAVHDARRRLGIPPGTILLASFGFVAPTKLNHVICRAVNRFNKQASTAVDYVMVGEGSYVNDLLGERVRVTGYVSAAEYDDYLAASDLVLNLRYPSMGETSAAALRALGCGKPCVFTDYAWFSELPDDIAVKLPPDPPGVTEDVIYSIIELFMEDRTRFDELGRRAAEYTARHHDVSAVARRIADFILRP